MANRARWIVPLSAVLLCAVLIIALWAWGTASSSASAELELKSTRGLMGEPSRRLTEQEQQLHVGLLLSEWILIEVISQKEVQGTSWYLSLNGDESQAVEALGAMLTAELETDTGHIRLEVIAASDADSLAILEQWIAVFLKDMESRENHSLGRAQQALTAGLEYCETEIAQIAIEIQALELPSDALDADIFQAREALDSRLEIAQRRRDYVKESLADFDFILDGEYYIARVVFTSHY